MLPKNRAPTHPGEILELDFLDPMKMSQVQLAEKMGIPVQRVNGLVNGRRSMTADTALLLAKVFEASAEFWMNLQTARDLWEAQRKLATSR